MRWAWHVARLEERKGAYRCFWWEDLRGHLWEDQGVDGRIILKLTFKMWGWGMKWIALAEDGDRLRALVDAEMKCGEFLDWLRKC